MFSNTLKIYIVCGSILIFRDLLQPAKYGEENISVDMLSRVLFYNNSRNDMGQNKEWSSTQYRSTILAQQGCDG